MTARAAAPPRRRDLAATRSALLEAATVVFAQRGFDGATLDEIAEVAGFSRGAVHHHFASKEDLFLAVVALRDERLLEGYGPDVLGVLPADPVKGARRWHELHAGDDADVALRLELRSHALRSAALRDRLVAVERAAVAGTAERLAELGAQHGVKWRCSVEALAELLHAASRAAAERSAVTGEESEALMSAWLDVIWRGAIEASPKGGSV